MEGGLHAQQTRPPTSVGATVPCARLPASGNNRRVRAGSCPLSGLNRAFRDTFDRLRFQHNPCGQRRLRLSLPCFTARTDDRCGRPGSAEAGEQEEIAHGGQLHRVRTIGHEQDHVDPHDLHRGERALAHRDRPAGRAAGVDHAPAHLRARVVAAAGAHRRRPLPGRPAAAHDRRGRAGTAQPSPSARPGCSRTSRPRPAAGPGSVCWPGWTSPTSRSSRATGPSRRSPRRPRCPAHPTALGRALLAFADPELVETTLNAGCGPTPRTPSPRRTASAARWP